jgi:two-component sensor histidine kinase
MISAVEPTDAQLASREANHRFLNTLSALHGLLRIDFSAFADPAIREAVSVFSSRIQAFAGLHRTLGEDADEALVDAPAHLARLCAELCEAHLAPRGHYCEFRADPGLLPRDTCQKLSLVVVELVTNAAKHAFTGRRGGRVSVCLRRTVEGWMCQVADNGSGLPGDERQGDGTGLVRGLARALGAELRVHSDAGGVVVTLSLPQDPALGAAVPGRPDAAAYRI